MAETISQTYRRLEVETKKRHGSIKDLVGKTFGRLTVISYSRSGSANHRSSVFWNCQCKCGNTLEVTSRKLITNGKRSCGCLLAERLVSADPVERAWYTAYLNCRRGAKARKLKFSLSLVRFKALCSFPCAYCGQAPSRALRTRSSGEDTGVKMGGIDRADNTLGYITANCVPCCTRCNLAKTNMTVDAFREWVIRAANYPFKSATCY